MRIKNSEQRNRGRRLKRHRRIRMRIRGTALCPRLAVYRSNRQVMAQLIDDTGRRTLVAAAEQELGKKIPEADGRTGKVARAYAVGKRIAEKAAAQGILRAVFDRGGFAYHGRVRAVAEGARAGGLIF